MIIFYIINVYLLKKIYIEIFKLIKNFAKHFLRGGFFVVGLGFEPKGL